MKKLKLFAKSFKKKVKKIFKTLKEEISVAEAKFKAKGKNNNFKF